MIKKIFYFIIFTTVLPFHILAFAQDSPLQIDTSLQAGMEYDSNVYKTFKNEDRDFLTRILLKNTGNYWLNPLLSLGWDYQGGGKKFMITLRGKINAKNMKKIARRDITKIMQPDLISLSLIIT